MATKDITDTQVVQAAADWQAHRGTSTVDLLASRIDRATRRGLVQCGVSPTYSWPTPDGHALLAPPRCLTP